MFTKENIACMIEAFLCVSERYDDLLSEDMIALTAIKKYCDDNNMRPDNYWLLEKLLP